MKIQRMAYLAAVTAAVWFLYGCGPGNGTGGGSPSIPKVSSESTSDGYRLVEQDGFTLKWRIDKGMIDCSVGYPTTGWVGIGFSPSMKMKDANIIIGFVQDGQATVTDQFGTGINFHQSDTELGGKDNLSGTSGTESNGITTIHFRMPLDSGDGNDRKLSQGSTTTIILAHGPNGADDFFSYHGQDGRLTLNVEL